MREIKFRAWDHVKGVMIRNMAILEVLGRCNKNYFLQDKVHLMQYTGLKDKNGVEIYEGDIVEVYGKTAGVYWSNYRCMYYAKTVAESFLPVRLYRSSSPAFEVIGNIYQNKELLDDDE